MIYLDNAASTMVRPEVAAEMAPYTGPEYSNPSSPHRGGRRARRAVEAARREVAALVGARPSEIIFTSGGTESDNMAVRGAPPGPVTTTSIEHEAVLEPCRARGDARYVAPDGAGMVGIRDVIDASDGSALVSVMAANNEVGTIQPVREMAAGCGLFHTDAVQAAGKIPLDVGDLGVDMLSISSHKIHGPKGAGALYVREGTAVGPLVLGGGQEGGMRSGTENVAAIVGFGAACRIAREGMASDMGRVRRMRDELARRALEIPGSRINGDPGRVLPGCLHMTFLGVDGEDLVVKLDENGVAASTGSACSVNSQKASHVLEAMGFSHEEISGSLRMTLSPLNTMEEVEGAAAALARVVPELRAVSPFSEKYGL